MRISIVSVAVPIINFLGTRAFGECEVYFASIRIRASVGPILADLTINFDGTPSHHRLGVSYPVCFAVQSLQISQGNN